MEAELGKKISSGDKDSIFIIPTFERPKAGSGWQHEEKDNDEHSGRGVIDCLRLLGHLRVVAVRGAVPVH